MLDAREKGGRVSLFLFYKSLSQHMDASNFDLQRSVRAWKERGVPGIMEHLGNPEIVSWFLAWKMASYDLLSTI
jgi:hypothetical protein